MSHSYAPNGVVFDDFRTVTLGTNLSGHTSDSGHTWVVYTGTWTVQDPTDVNQDGYVVAGSGSVPSRARCGIDFGSADVSVEGSFHYNAPGNRGGLMFRRTAAGYYSLAASSGAVRLTKSTDAGVDTVIGTGTGTFSDAPTINVLKVVCSGSQIDCYLNDVLEISVSDSTYGGTVHGLWQSFAELSAAAAYAFNMHPVALSGILVGAVAL